MAPVPADQRGPAPTWDPPSGPPPTAPAVPTAPPAPPAPPVPNVVAVAPGPPPAPVAPRRPGRAWFWSAVGLLVGAAVLLLAALGGAVASTDLTDARRSVAVPGERSFALESGHRYTVYVMRPEGATGADPEIVVVAPDGNEEVLAPPFAGVTETLNGEESVPFGDLTAFETGRYTIRTEAVPGMADRTRVTLGDEVDTGLEMVAVGLFMLGGLLGLVGLVFGAVWLVVRNRGRVTAGR
jgi:hypothetical protein